MEAPESRWLREVVSSLLGIMRKKKTKSLLN